MKFMKVENIQKEYGSGETAVHALKGISFSLEKGAFAAITGESGSGKSTLLTILGGMCSPSGGKILYEGEDMYALNEEKRASFRNRNLGFVFQNFHLVPYLTLEENVMLPLSIRKIKGKDKLLKARSALERVGLGGSLQDYPQKFQGENRNGLPLPGLLCIIRPFCLRMNRREISIPGQERRLWICSKP